MRKILLILAGLLITLLITVVIIISQVDVNEYKDQALAQVEAATGRKVSIDSDIDLSLSLNPAIVAEDIRFANAEWGSRPDMASIKRIEVQVALMPLLSGEVEVQRFILIEPNVLLEKNKDGKGNWEIGTSAPIEQVDAGDEESQLTTIDIGTVLIEQLKLEYRDSGTGETTQFSIAQLSLKPADSNHLAVELFAALDKTTIDIGGKIGKLDNLFNNQEYPVDITAKVGPISSSLSGVISEPIKAKGVKLKAGLEINQLSDLNAITKSNLPAIGPFMLNTNLYDIEGGYRLADIDLSLAKTRLVGDISANISGEVPYIKAALNSSLLDLVPFQPKPPKEEKKVDRYLSDEPLPLEGLRAANADVTLKVDKVETRQAQISNLDITLALNQGKLVVKPLSLNLAGGSLQGDAVLDASQKTATTKLNLNGKSIQLDQLTPLNEKLSGGATDMTLRFSGSGNSSQAIAGGANGKLLLQIGSAEMKEEEKKDEGFLASLGKLLNPFGGSESAKLSCAVINFNIQDGIAIANRGIGIETNKLTVSGGGNINLKNENLALGFEPNAKGAIVGTITNLASGMEVGGTLANPRMQIDAGKTAAGAIKSVTGGAGALIGGILGKNEATEADDAPCQTALTGKTSSPKSTTTKAKSTETKEETVLDAPKKLLKGLFGR